MSSQVYSFRFDLPFYLRLPGSLFLAWDPNDSAAAILPRQRLGEVAFSKTTGLVPEKRLLDSRVPPPYTPSRHAVQMRCETPAYGSLSTLRIDTGLDGGCAELRPYTEMYVFVSDVVSGDELLQRVFAIVNNFIGLYRLATQDPWVVQVDRELDIYLVDCAVATVPDERRTKKCEELFEEFGLLRFDTGPDTKRNHSYRLNTLEDLFPGPVLDKSFLEVLARFARERCEVPLHYELLLLSQSQLKRRQYRFAILEAETAFEVFVVDLLSRLSVSLGADREELLASLENPRRLGLLSQRLKALDVACSTWRAAHAKSDWVQFVGGPLHVEWKEALYVQRNRIVHAGYGSVTFDQARRGIAAAKEAIRFFEEGVPELTGRIRIHSGVEHLHNTAGRLVL